MKLLLNNNHSLQNSDDFNKKMEVNTRDILNNYFKIIMEFLKHIFENIKIKNIEYSKFIIIRGVETVTSVFNHILYFTQNIDIVYFHTQKSFYFYVEFIQQTSTEQNSFLQLSSRDATMYVYRKTIFEFNNEFRKKYISTIKDKETIEKLSIINNYINILKCVLYNILNKNDFYKNNQDTKSINVDKNNNIDDSYLKMYQDFGDKFIQVNFKIDYLKFINIFIEKISIDKINLNMFLEILHLFLKKLIANPESININKNKLYSIKFIVYNDCTCSFISLNQKYLSCIKKH